MTELTTVAEDEAILFDGPVMDRRDGLAPDTEYTFEGITFRTLPRPGGELLCRFATVNDVHFGETECGVLEGLDVGPILTSEPGEDPYYDVMNRGAIEEMAAIDPAAVVVKGDLTTHGTVGEYQLFLDAYEPAFGDRLHHVRGNHDGYFGETYAADAPFLVDLPGVRLAVLDTVIPKDTPGQVTASQLEWLDDIASDADRDGVPVLLFGHHHAWSPDSRNREPGYFGINPDDSDALAAVVQRRPAIRGYFAGHTHRNRVRHFSTTGEFPWVEVACVKDFPGAWAEYRVYEGGINQIFHRISTPEALRWSEKTRALYGGMYPSYSFGALKDRCFRIC